MSELFDTQKKMYDLLTADDTLMDLVSGIYDEVPVDANFPYVAFEGNTSDTDDSYDTEYQIMEVDIGIYTRPGMLGWKQSYDISEAVYQVLHNAGVLTTSSGYTIISMRRLHSTPYRLDDIRKIVDWYEVRIKKGEI